MKNPTPYAILNLDGVYVDAWFGTEMCLMGGDEVSWTDPQGTLVTQTSPICWHHPALPYSQFSCIDVVLRSTLRSGLVYRIHSYFEQDEGQPFGILMDRVAAPCPPKAWGELDYYRTTALADMPTGQCFVKILRRDGDAIIEAELRIGANGVRLLSAEVEPEANNTFRIMEVDESVLLQLNGQSLPSK